MTDRQTDRQMKFTLISLERGSLMLAPTRKCTTLWGEPKQIHEQNMEQLHAYDCHQNVTEPRATEIILVLPVVSITL